LKIHATTHSILRVPDTVYGLRWESREFERL
jgi:hypothetical protein